MTTRGGRRYTIWYVIAALATQACSEGSGNAVSHPLPNALADLRRSATATVESDTTPPTNMDPISRSRWMQMRRSVVTAQPGLVLGVLDSTGPEALGAWNEVVVGANGTVFVLDVMSDRVVVFGEDGSVDEYFGRPGAGPMEFAQARDLDVVGDSLLVVDANGIKVFERGETGYARNGQIRMARSVGSLCTVGQYAIVGTERTPRESIEAYSLVTGQHVESFGDGYHYGSESAQRSMSWSLLGCVDQRVIQGHTYLPLIVAYAVNGRRLWSTAITDYIQGYKIERASGISSPRPPRETLVRVVGSDAGYVFATYSRRPVAERRVLRTYLLDAKTGKGALLEETSAEVGPGTIVAVGRDRYIRDVPGLYPRLQIWHMEVQR